LGIVAHLISGGALFLKATIFKPSCGIKQQLGDLK
jgi:hypothetical protein